MSSGPRSSIEISADDRGRPLALKHGPVDRLRHEAEMLTAAAGPGVVALVRFDAHASTLATEWVGGECLTGAIDRPRGPQWAATAMASLASSVARLHAGNVTHGRIEPSHVLLRGDLPILTGFAEAAHDRSREHLDVANLGQLIELLLGPMSLPPRPSGTRSLLGAGRPSRANDELDAGLRSLARRARDPQAQPPCTAAEIARVCGDLAARAPASTPLLPLEQPTAPGIRSAGPRRHRSQRTTSMWLLIGIIAAPIVIALALVGFHRPAPSPQLAATSSPSADSTTSDDAEPSVSTDDANGVDDAERSSGATISPAVSTASSTASSTATSTTTTPATVNAGAERVWPADQCAGQCTLAEPLTPTVRFAGHTYRVSGSEGDRLVLGDWDCDGVPTPALLRTTAGVIDVFDRWPEAGHPASSRRFTPAPVAVDLAARPTSGCTELLALDAAHHLVTVAVR